MRLRHRTRSLRAVWAPSTARRILRHRLTQAAVIAALGIGLTTATAARIAALDAERSAWGTATRVLVVEETVEIGQPVAASVVEQEVPSSMVPPTAVTDVGRRAAARVRLYPGEILLRERITTTVGGSVGDPDMVALTVPVTRQVPLVEVGSLVDLWVADPAEPAGVRVARHVAVLAFSPDDITVAVPASQAAGATVAALRPVVVTVVG